MGQSINKKGLVDERVLHFKQVFKTESASRMKGVLQLSYKAWDLMGHTKLMITPYIDGPQGVFA